MRKECKEIRAISKRSSRQFVSTLVRAVEILPRDTFTIRDSGTVISSGFHDNGTVHDMAQVFRKPLFEIVHEKLLGAKIFGGFDPEMEAKLVGFLGQVVNHAVEHFGADSVLLENVLGIHRVQRLHLLHGLGRNW